MLSYIQHSQGDTLTLAALRQSATADELGRAAVLQPSVLPVLVSMYRESSEEPSQGSGFSEASVLELDEWIQQEQQQEQQQQPHQQPHQQQAPDPPSPAPPCDFYSLLEEFQQEERAEQQTEQHHQHHKQQHQQHHQQLQTEQQQTEQQQTEQQQTEQQTALDEVSETSACEDLPLQPLCFVCGVTGRDDLTAFVDAKGSSLQVCEPCAKQHYICPCIMERQDSSFKQKKGALIGQLQTVHSQMRSAPRRKLMPKIVVNRKRVNLSKWEDKHYVAMVPGDNGSWVPFNRHSDRIRAGNLLG